MPSYRYVDEIGRPLLVCTNCCGSLTTEGGITVDFISESNSWSSSSRLSELGHLEDPEDEVAGGYHSATRCGHCHKMLINTEGVNELGEDDPEPQIEMVFDEEEAKGKIELVRHGWGADLLVDGVQVAFIDLFPKNEGDPAQLLIGDGPGGENLAKIVLMGESKVLVVHKDAKMMEGQFKYAIHSKPLDYVFESTPPENSQEAN